MFLFVGRLDHGVRISDLPATSYDLLIPGGQNSGSDLVGHHDVDANGSYQTGGTPGRLRESCGADRRALNGARVKDK